MTQINLVRQKRLDLVPKFVIDRKKISQLSTSIINNQFERIKADIYNDANLKSQNALKHFHFNSPDGAANFRSAILKDANREIEESNKSKKEFLADLRRTTIRIASYADVHRIPSNILDKRKFDDSFEYYVANIPMNINTPVGKINEIRLFLTLFGDGKKSEDAHIYSGFPNDLVEHVTVIKGKIKLGLTNLLNIIPHPVPQIIGKIVQIDLDPWEIKWGFDRIKVLFSEAQNNEVDWYISSNNLNQSFSCSIIIKKRKNINEVIANAEAQWVYNPTKYKIERFFRKAFGKEKLELKSEKKPIKIISSTSKKNKFG